ncbi:hypothetical protein FXF46_14675 [Gluconobacter thailandicus]|uniref:Uncharacterized protein n=1 Tax=Gluconobacter thailandicus TaxID=257438 RepID=A0AAP9EU01_GLUTH|nr:hypothetical protein AD940_00660 [Gluconobacter thailandicus]QEH97358.1 hypothetical protein FXF46_14675 [Gluconobacter thailandicus]
MDKVTDLALPEVRAQAIRQVLILALLPMDHQSLDRHRGMDHKDPAFRDNQEEQMRELSGCKLETTWLSPLRRTFNR